MDITGTSSTSDLDMNGSDAGYPGFSTTNGDSGSPVYTFDSNGGIALGVHATGSGKYAEVQAALDSWGIAIRD